VTLVLEIEYLLGVVFAARNQVSEVPDWPPQADRVFSALVASWGARGERIEERQALEWLQAQRPPDLLASGGLPRTAATVFVPPNDPETGRVGDRRVMPAFRSRQPRRFPAYRPDDPLVRVCWPDAVAGSSIVSALMHSQQTRPISGIPPAW
jgi:CRISPR-associated protein Csb2